ncbi:MAG: Holliday junction resolvase Hjc [Candidatus Helarchaeota archaeon]
MTKKYGITAERQLVKLFWEHEFGALRVPASGAGAKSYPKPDIIAGNGKNFYAFEVKTTNTEKIYLRNDEVQELVDFSETFGCIPYVAVKFKKKSREWKFFKVSDIDRTRTGSYRIAFKQDFDKGINFKTLVTS